MDTYVKGTRSDNTKALWWLLVLSLRLEHVGILTIKSTTSMYKAHVGMCVLVLLCTTVMSAYFTYVVDELVTQK